MPNRMYPSDYFDEHEHKHLVTEQSVIPNWVPILIGISLVAMALIALYALSLNRKERIVYKETPHGAKSDA